MFRSEGADGIGQVMRGSSGLSSANTMNRSTSMEVASDDYKLKLKKANVLATGLKMDLHDLAEDLPTGWERIMDVAKRTHEAYRVLDELRKQAAGETGG